MIAGLLGEHLASPRTAPKTNQSTALEPTTTKGGESSAGEEFASMVADETKPAQPKSTTAQDAEKVDGELLPTHVSSQAEQIEAQASQGADILRGADSAVGDLSLEDPASLINPIDSDARLMTGDLAIDAKDVLAEASVEADVKVAPSVEGELLADAPAIDPKLKADSALTADATTADAETQNLKLAQTIDIEGDSKVSADTSDTTRAAQSSSDVETFTRPTAQLAAQATATEALGPVRDTATPVATGEPLVSIGPASTGAGAPTAAPTGLTPIAPSIPVASPNELTGIILNAIQNGLDPQEQLVVQLDPPELGRVMIDFKFDAQGLQQIVVTSENPEALKRLREMHMELTEALRDQGLSDKNMSFQEQTEERQQNAWSGAQYSDRESSLSRSEDRAEAHTVRSIEPRLAARDRLNLVL